MAKNMKDRRSASCLAVSFILVLGSILFQTTEGWGGCTSCETCPPPAIGFSSKQMSLNGTQNLTVSSEAGGPFTWGIVGGGGSLSGSTGTSVTYTAPSSNSNCSNNTTIRVTDSCGHATDLNLAVNNPSQAGYTAYDETYCPILAGICYGSFTGPRLQNRTFKCNDVQLWNDVTCTQCIRSGCESS